MDLRSINFQIHRYRNGHQLISSSITLNRVDQDTIDRLSDISGQIRPGEKFRPYLTCYPLPSEEYFIIARTWQDVTAPRAGCVFTKSLVLQTQEWEKAENILDIFNSLSIVSTESANDLQSIFTSEIIKENVNNAPVEELVEALFLEQRKPILVFDCDEADFITTRLYEVFWPGLRKKFAACTFALGSRSINGKPFDLLFSQSDLRTRFSDWTGRRIQGATHKKEVRHRWTSDLTNRIFNSTIPSLMPSEASSLFNLTDSGDENVLRLSLLWDELQSKARIESSPFAILGLLDIINSQPVFGLDLYKGLRPQINRAIIDAPKLLSTLDSWKFYAALLVKHRRKLMNREMLLEVKKACTSITVSDPETAIKFILEFNPSDDRIPQVLYAAIGNGLSLILDDKSLKLIYKIPAKLGLLLLATSVEFANSIMELLRAGEKQLNEKVNEFLEIIDEKSQRRAKVNLALFISDNTQASVVKLLLKNPVLQLYQKVINSIATNTEFKCREFDQAILNSTSHLQQFEFLLENLIRFGKSGAANSLLVKLLILRFQLLKIFLESNLTDNRKLEILDSMVSESSNDVLNNIAKDLMLTNNLVSFLFAKTKINKKALFDLALNADMPFADLIDLLDSIPQNQVEQINVDLFAKYLKKNWNEIANTSYPTLVHFISKFNQESSNRFVFDIIHDGQINGQLVSIFQLLFKSGISVKMSMTKEVDIISQTLATTLADFIDKYIIDNWIYLIINSENQDKQRKAAASMVDYAFNKNEFDPTDLLLVSFPIVYESFMQNRTIGQYFTFTFFTDWDKCKTLRNDLVRRYLNSKWPKLGLFRVAAQTGIVKEVLGILKDIKGGKKFIEKAIIEAKNEEIFETSPDVKEFRKYFESLEQE